ncbi:MAG: PaaI family thioesterase [Planctomycetota bacterium]
MITNPNAVTLEAMRRQHHPRCVVCGANNDALRLSFRLADDGAVEATLDCQGALQGYPDRLHGGVLCTLLDGAMTNCLFAHGFAGVTAKLQVRFHRAATIGEPATVRAEVFERKDPLFCLRARVVQGTALVASAEATFVDTAAVDSLPFRTPDDRH